VLLCGGWGPRVGEPSTHSSQHLTVDPASSSQVAEGGHGPRDEADEGPARGERKDQAKARGPKTEREAATKAHMEEGFGMHLRQASPAWKAVAYKLRGEGQDEELIQACSDLSMDLHKQIKNVDADPEVWVGRQRELLDQLNASPAANVAAEEIANIANLLSELEGE
jgi:hypothetical protein